MPGVIYEKGSGFRTYVEGSVVIILPDRLGTLIVDSGGENGFPTVTRRDVLGNPVYNRELQPTVDTYIGGTDGLKLREG